MKYSPKRFDTAVRTIYSCSLAASLVFMLLPATGALASIFSSIALILLAVAIYLFVKYDATTYEYILIERNGTFDFYVNKIYGKRGSYVCYFPLSDCLQFGKYEDSTRAQITASYQGCTFSKYVQNFISSKSVYFALFKNNDRFECIIFEPNDEIVKLFESFAGKPPVTSDAEVTVEIVDESNPNE